MSRDLAAAIAIESAELQERFLWKSEAEITADLAQLNDLLDDIEGDMSRLGEMEPAVTAWLDAIAGEEAAKLDGYVHWIRHLQMEAAAARAEGPVAPREGPLPFDWLLLLAVLYDLLTTGPVPVEAAEPLEVA